MKNCATSNAARTRPSRADRVLLADHDLVQRGEQEGRDHQDRHRHVAEGDRRDDGRRVAVHQRRRDGARLPADERADGGKAGPRAERRRQRQRDVGGGDRTEEPRDRSQHDADQRPRGVRQQVGAVRDIHGTREEHVVQVGDGPGRPGHEPDLLRRIAAPAGQHRGRVAGPDVPPQDNGGNGETGEGHEVEADGPQSPAGLGRDRSYGGEALRVRRCTGLRDGVVGRARQGWCRASGASTRPSRSSLPLSVLPGPLPARSGSARSYDRRRARPPPLRRGRRGASRPLRRLGPDPAGLERAGPRGGGGGRATSGRAPRATPGSSVSATPSRTTSRWPSWPASAGATSRRRRVGTCSTSPAR